MNKEERIKLYREYYGEDPPLGVNWRKLMLTAREVLLKETTKKDD